MFNEKSQIVKSYVLLIESGEKELSEVPDIKGLREVVANVIEKHL